MDYWGYLHLVWRRAWRDAWHAVMHSPRTVLRDGILLALTGAILVASHRYLVSNNLMSADNTRDTFIWIVLGIIALLGAFALWLLVEGFVFAPYKLWKEAGGGVERGSPLEIRFDVSNPRERFWQPATWYSSNGYPMHEGVEYRIEIANTGHRTAEDTEATIEGLPKNSIESTLRFVRTKAFKETLHPGAAEMVQVFLLSDAEKTSAASRVLIRVRARDLPEVQRAFSFDPSKTPVFAPIWD